MEGINNYFCFGAFYGFFAAGICGIIISQIQAARIRMRARNRFLDTFPDAAQPSMTPAGIFWNSIRAMFTCVFWIIVLIAAIVFFWKLIPYLVSSGLTQFA